MSACFTANCRRVASRTLKALHEGDDALSHNHLLYTQTDWFSIRNFHSQPDIKNAACLV